MTELNEQTFPKSGRVNEVCREWLVREDNALAHQLQSQEINEHYRGNRFRNQVVRQDFPTALSEQIKEKEVADQQSARYHEMVNAQAEADALVAQKIAENMRREQDLERRRNIEQSEYLARKLQEDLIVSSSSSSSSAHSSRAKSTHHALVEPAIVNELPIPPKNELPIPPKIANAKFNGQRRPFIENEMVTNPSYVTGAQTQIKDSSHLNYVSLELNVPKDSQKRLANHHATQYTQVIAHNHPSSPLHSPSGDSDSHHYEHINLHSHTPEKKSNPQPYNAQHDYNFPAPSDLAIALPPKPPKQPASPSKLKSKPAPAPALPPKTKDVSPTNRAFQMLTTDSFDMLMGNRNSRELPDECDSLAIGGVADAARPIERVFNSNTPNINRIDSMDDILSYDDEAAAGPSNSDRIRQLQELGVPEDEILEIDRRLTQQEKDEELARRLQEEEGQSLSQEEKDRLVAIEAQDKELAKMLQEREKAKARRAKERARARKQQLQQERMQQEAEEGAQGLEPSIAHISHSRSHSDPNDIEHESYSDPIDLINVRENAKHSYQSGEYFHSKQSSGASRDSLFQNDENYSHPIDSLRSNVTNDQNQNVSPPRPSKQHLKKTSNSTDGLDNIAAVIDPTYPNIGPNTTVNQPLPNSINDAQNFLPAHLKYTTPDQNSNPIPPYMPIQGIRRANGVSQSDKKKKSKDNRCTHQ